MASRKCEKCGSDYVPSGNRQKFCSDCKGKKAPRAVVKRRPRKATEFVEQTAEAVDAVETVAVQITEKHLDRFWNGLSLVDKANIFQQYIAQV